MAATASRDGSAEAQVPCWRPVALVESKGFGWRPVVGTGFARLVTARGLVGLPGRLDLERARRLTRSERVVLRACGARGEGSVVVGRGGVALPGANRLPHWWLELVAGMC